MLFTFFGTGSLFYSFPLAPLMTFRNNDYGIFIGNFRFPLFVGKIFMAPRTFPIFDISVFRTSNGFCSVIFQTMLVLGYIFIPADCTGVASMLGFVAHNIVPAGRRMPMVRFVAFPRFGKSMLMFADTLIPADRTGIARMFGFTAYNVVPAGSNVPMISFVRCPCR